MDITKEEFNLKVQDTVDNLLISMAAHEEIDPEKFYSMACILENLVFFSPFIYSVIQNSSNKS